MSGNVKATTVNEIMLYVGQGYVNCTVITLIRWCYVHAIFLLGSFFEHCLVRFRYKPHFARVRKRSGCGSEYIPWSPQRQQDMTRSLVHRGRNLV